MLNLCKPKFDSNGRKESPELWAVELALFLGLWFDRKLAKKLVWSLQATDVKRRHSFIGFVVQSKYGSNMSIVASANRPKMLSWPSVSLFSRRPFLPISMPDLVVLPLFSLSSS